MYQEKEGQLAGLLAVSDPIKKRTPEAVEDLKAAGIRVILATGDGVSTAKAVAQKPGIDESPGEGKERKRDGWGERGGESIERGGGRITKKNNRRKHRVNQKQRSKTN